MFYGRDDGFAAGAGGTGRATDQSTGGRRSEAARAPRRGAVSSAGKNMFVQKDDGNQGKEFSRSVNQVAVLLLVREHVPVSGCALS